MSLLSSVSRAELAGVWAGVTGTRASCDEGVEMLTVSPGAQGLGDIAVGVIGIR